MATNLLTGSRRATQFALTISWLTEASSNDSTNCLDWSSSPAINIIQISHGLQEWHMIDCINYTTTVQIFIVNHTTFSRNVPFAVEQLVSGLFTLCHFAPWTIHSLACLPLHIGWFASVIYHNNYPAVLK